ncbi:hypothetical protein P0D88_01735 [Paraburkholderia sp. RL18-103-BIB-C]|uniref:hypothetical protein n=1 Tax=Paraburkholderia sp. RL18-103-BIB-C TaxID=3031637 RepID=UPI0038B7EC1E
MSTLNVHVGTVRDVGDRFINAWKRAEAGDVVELDHYYDLEKRERGRLLMLVDAERASRTRSKAG